MIIIYTTLENTENQKIIDFDDFFFWGGGSGDLYIFLHILASGVDISLHAKSQLSIYCRTLLKVCVLDILEAQEVSK